MPLDEDIRDIESKRVPNERLKQRLEGNVLTAEQVGQILQVSRKTVVRMAIAGTLRGKKVGSQWRFLRSAVDEYMESP